MRRSLIALAVLMAAGACGSDPPDVTPIADQAFVTTAAERCGNVLPALRPDLSDKTKRTAAEIAVLVDDRAVKLEAFIAILRRLPVEDSARAAVDEWFADWSGYLAVGRRYAEALRADDPERFQKIAREGDVIQQRISARARASDMDDCALDGVPLPERESPI